MFICSFVGTVVVCIIAMVLCLVVNCFLVRQVVTCFGVGLSINTCSVL